MGKLEGSQQKTTEMLSRLEQSIGHGKGAGLLQPGKDKDKGRKPGFHFQIPITHYKERPKPYSEAHKRSHKLQQRKF